MCLCVPRCIRYNEAKSKLRVTCFSEKLPYYTQCGCPGAKSPMTRNSNVYITSLTYEAIPDTYTTTGEENVNVIEKFITQDSNEESIIIYHEEQSNAAFELSHLSISPFKNAHVLSCCSRSRICEEFVKGRFSIVWHDPSLSRRWGRNSFNTMIPQPRDRNAPGSDIYRNERMRSS